jgi:electron transfer flavoprotein alpha/beta subunit
MTAPRTIDHAVAALFRAIAGHARGDALAVMNARSELLVFAGAAQDFEQQLIAAAVDKFMAWNTCPNATRVEIERALAIDVRRHVSNSVFLAQLEPWGRA